MSLSEGAQFQLYVTHVEGEGPNIKVFGQIDKQRALIIESLLSASKPNLENGLGQASPTDIKLGMLCIAKYGDGDYYRAEVTNIIDISSGFVSVYFIDYGNTDAIHISNIRVLNEFPDVFRNTLPQARDFLLAGVTHPKGVWDADMQNNLSKLIYYVEMPCVVELVAFDKYFIKMNFKGQDLSEFLTSRNFGIKVSIQEQRNLLHKVLSSSKSSQQPSRMYIPPPARLIVGEGSNSREIFRGYIPPQGQTTAEVGRSVGKSKVRSVAAPRPLHRAAAGDQPMAQVNTSQSPQPPTTYHSRHLKENDSYLVHVSYAKDGPKCFAIQLKTDIEFLSNIMSNINAVPPEPLTGPPMIGSVCLGRFSEDKTLCRAVVLSSTESYCKLFFVDFGITENVAYSDIFQISENDIVPHVFALRFSLSGISKIQVTEKIKNDFYHIVNNQILTLKVVPPEGPPLIQYCELYLNGQCVKEMLLQKQNPFFSKIDISSINGEHSVLVSYVDSCTKFYIQLSKNIDELNEVMDKVAAHCQQSTPLLYHQVRCGMTCCGIFPDDQGWYRALVTNIKKDKITVSYVDYGNEQELTCEMLRPITPELVMLKAQAIHCALKGFEDKPFDQRTCDSLEKLTLEKILTMNVFGIMEGGVLLVDLVDDSTSPGTHIASAVHQALLTTPLTSTPALHTSTPQDSFEVEPTPNVHHNAPKYSVEQDDFGKEHNTSFESSKSNDYSGRPKRQNQERGQDRSERNRYERPSARRERGGDFPSEQVNKKPFKGSAADKRSGGHKDNKKPPQLSGGGRMQQRGSKQDWSNRNERSDRGKGERRFSDRSSDKDFSGEKRSYGGDSGEKRSYGGDSGEKRSYGGDSGEKRSYGGDRQSKPFKPRFNDAQEVPKTLINPVSFDTPFAEHEIVFSQEYEVNVSWFINPNDFYVTLTSQEVEFRNMMNNIPNLYSKVKPAFSHEVNVESSILARFPEDKALYRAKVLESQYGGKFKVQFVDYGNKCMVDGSDIWQLESELMAVPKMGINCSLKGIIPIDKEWKPNQSIDDCFSLTSYKAIFYEIDNGRYIISLKSDSSGDVKNTLIEKQLAACSETSSLNSVNTIKVYITHVDTPGQFWLQLESDSEKIFALQEVLQNADNFENYSEREVGKLCVSKYSADEQYYRTVILDSDNDIITVRFIDYGNTDVLDNTPDVLKCLPAEMLDTEPYALKCSVNATPTGTGQWTEQAAELFSKLLGNTDEPIDAVIILKGATTYVDLFVDSINITDSLVSQGHAVKSEKSDQRPTCFASHINSPSEFWIQLESSVHDLEGISEELENAENFAPLSDIAEEVICAAKFPEDEMWYRAQVVIHGTDGTEVLFMDYGNASLTNDLRSLPDHLKILPALSRKCALQKPANVKKWSKEAELKFIELAAEGATVFQVSFIASGDTSIVELYIDGNSVTDTLKSLCDIEQSVPSTPIKVPTNVESESSIPSVYICHSNSPEDFWIHYSASAEIIDFITAALENGDSFETVENISDGLVGASIFTEDNLYYRSKIIGHGENGIEVFHIDYGSTAVTDCLKALPEELRCIPPMAKHCSLLMPHDRSKLNEEIHEKFAELAIDNSLEYTVEIVNGECDPIIVKLFKDNIDIAESLGYVYDHSEVEETDNTIIENTLTKNTIDETNEIICNIDDSVSIVKEVSVLSINENLTQVKISNTNIETMEIDSKDTEHQTNMNVDIETSTITNIELEKESIINNDEDIETYSISNSEEKIISNFEISVTEVDNLECDKNVSDDETHNIENKIVSNTDTDMEEQSVVNNEELNVFNSKEQQVVDVVEQDAEKSNEIDSVCETKSSSVVFNSKEQQVADVVECEDAEKSIDIDFVCETKSCSVVFNSKEQQVADVVECKDAEKCNDIDSVCETKSCSVVFNSKEQQVADVVECKDAEKSIDIDSVCETKSCSVEYEEEEGIEETLENNIKGDIEKDRFDANMCQDEDQYSDVSSTCEDIDPAQEIKACLDACDNLNTSDKIDEEGNISINKEKTTSDVDIISEPKDTPNNNNSLSVE